jgi:hypothetical protein
VRRALVDQQLGVGRNFGVSRAVISIGLVTSARPRSGRTGVTSPASSLEPRPAWQFFAGNLRALPRPLRALGGRTVSQGLMDRRNRSLTING